MRGGGIRGQQVVSMPIYGVLKKGEELRWSSSLQHLSNALLNLLEGLWFEAIGTCRGVEYSQWTRYPCVPKSCGVGSYEADPI